MGQRLAALVMALVAGVSLPARAANQPGRERPAESVLQAFEGHGDQTIDAFLLRLRPAPLDAESRSQVLASLPAKGELRPSAKQSAKIAAAGRILDYSARTGAITVKVIDLDFAFVGLYYRTVVLVSAQALELLKADEFAALVAHEVGHDYDWNDYWAAIQQHDAPRMRELELRSDAIAVLTLEQVGIDPERLASAVQKQTQYNQVRNAAGRGNGNGEDSQSLAERYVSLKDRVAFIRAVAHLAWAERPVAAAARVGP